MEEKSHVAFIKGLAKFIGWIGASICGISAILSSIGFLVLRAHYDLLGITELIPISIHAYLIQGGRFFYNSALYLIGLPFKYYWLPLPLIFVAVVALLINKKRAKKEDERKVNSDSIIKPGIILILSCIFFFGILYCFLVNTGASDLLIIKPTFENEIIKRIGEENIRNMRVKYTVLVLLSIICVFYLIKFPQIIGIEMKFKDSIKSILDQFGKEITKTKTSKEKLSKWIHAIHVGLYLSFLVQLVLIPINYGKMVKPNEFLQANLIISNDKTILEKKWLLHMDGQNVVLYSKEEKSIKIYHRKSIAEIAIIGKRKYSSKTTLE